MEAPWAVHPVVSGDARKPKRQALARQSTMTLLDEIESHPLCGDGAMGTLLIERGVASRGVLWRHFAFPVRSWSARFTPSIVQREPAIIETNSFGANAVRLARYGLSNRVNELNWQAAQLARQGAAKEAFVAGSVGPLGVSRAEAQRSRHRS